MYTDLHVKYPLLLLGIN